MDPYSTKPIFKLLVIANNLNWPSLADKIEAVCDFYVPVCTLVPTIVHTSMHPVFNNSYPGLAPLYVVDRGWYEVNVATPYAGQADFLMFVTPPSDHPTMVTYAGYMSFNNVGPWETTVFAQGEHDRTLMQGRDMGDSFTLIAEHELSHAFYYFLGRRDDTHVHFPNNQPNYADDPRNVLKDFDFTTKYARLEWLKDKLLAALVLLGILKRQQAVTIAEGNTQPPVVPKPAPEPTPAPQFPPMILKWAKAIAAEEGARPALNNPGNLKVAPLTASWGATRGFQAADGGWIAKFATLDAGNKALCNFLLLGAENELTAFHNARTLQKFTQVYAGNPPQPYIDAIARSLNCPLDTDVSTFVA